MQNSSGFCCGENNALCCNTSASIVYIWKSAFLHIRISRFPLIMCKDLELEYVKERKLFKCCRCHLRCYRVNKKNLMGSRFDIKSPPLGCLSAIWPKRDVPSAPTGWAGSMRVMTGGNCHCTYLEEGFCLAHCYLDFLTAASLWTHTKKEGGSVSIGTYHRDSTVFLSLICTLKIRK